MTPTTAVLFATSQYVLETFFYLVIETGVKMGDFCHFIFRVCSVTKSHVVLMYWP